MMPFKGLRLRLVEHNVFSYSSDDGHQLVSGNMILLLLILINELMMVPSSQEVVFFAWFGSCFS
jgi:hypothetical protein